jgi:prepilin-type N-terminal cleavage/methylation domain-containing protein
MTPDVSKSSNQNGFSLIEIIVTLVVAALFGTMFLQYMGTSLTKSAEPVIDVQKAYEVGTIMESLTADYKYLLLTDKNPLTTFEAYIANGNIEENPPYSYYGDYTAQTSYILFDGDGNETADESGEDRILKVSIISNDQTLTALFTE